MGYIEFFEKPWRYLNKKELSKITLEKISAFSSDQSQIAFGLGFNSTNNTHCGILYKVKNSRNSGSFLLHLAFHHCLREDGEQIYSQAPELSKFRYTPFEIADQEKATLFINRCRQIFNANQNKIGYASKFLRSCFKANGQVQLAQNEFGMTCATFIMAVFEDNGYKLIETDAWPRRKKSDALWHKDVVLLLRKFKASFNISEEHIQRVEFDNKGSKRFKPEEVSAAATSKQKPAKYWYSWFVGAYLKERLEKF